MAPSGKDRRKSGGKSTTAAAAAAATTTTTITVTLKVSPEKLRNILEPSPPTKEESPAKESPATSATLPVASTTNGENVSDSNPATPAPSGTPAAQPAMGPPSEGAKKKGVKRTSSAANGNGEAKVRGKPGPKKKQRLDDGTIDPNGTRQSLGGHKLGPKANQGAINAGLRALDRSGKPCRKWAKGGFKLKSFTGVVWELNRWTAPPKPNPDAVTPDGEVVSGESSSKENKENNSQTKSDNNTPSATGNDVEMQSVPASSPAPPLAVSASA